MEIIKVFMILLNSVVAMFGLLGIFTIKETLGKITFALLFLAGVSNLAAQL